MYIKEKKEKSQASTQKIWKKKSQKKNPKETNNKDNLRQKSSRERRHKLTNLF